jgi:pyridoxal phosphate enzyme (YggS family)
MTGETMTRTGIAARVMQVRERMEAAAHRVGRAASEITLIAVTKTVDEGVIREAVIAGIRDLGENKVQEAAGKVGALSDQPDLRWHLIGHLQRNKVRRAVQLFPVIHSIDSLALATTVSQEAMRRSKTIDVFAQVNVSGEATKSGFARSEFLDAARSLAELPGLRWRGVMTMAPEGESAAALRAVFAATRLLYATAREQFRGHAWDALSMGMTSDFEIAIEEGATHVRVGRAIFGERTAVNTGIEQ